MSVLNPNSDDEPQECPLCMEFLELDDYNFYPCSCGYQICRFCWNKIRIEGSGLCPACRSPYAENPADFKPLTVEEIAKIKEEKRKKDQAKKQKISESRKHLPNVRVVQRNLVFVVGLSSRLADQEMLRKAEYFGKFGRIHKVVINHSTSYAGNQSQGPSASAYVTYYKSEDALRAIQAVNNIFVDGRTLKASLGTTKYCSHFMKNQPCPKQDCMYLHELDEAASFTKEEMQQGKHTDYEKSLHDELLASASAESQDSGIHEMTSDGVGGSNSSISSASKDAKGSRTPSPKTGSNGSGMGSLGGSVGWPILTSSNNSTPNNSVGASSKGNLMKNFKQEQADGLRLDIEHIFNSAQASLHPRDSISSQPSLQHTGHVAQSLPGSDSPSSSRSEARTPLDMCDDQADSDLTQHLPNHVNSCDSNPWSQHGNDDLFAEDDLGFDPFHETQKALAEMIESESKQMEALQIYSAGGNLTNGVATNSQSSSSTISSSRPKQPPPGFSMVNLSGMHTNPLQNMLTPGPNGLDNFSSNHQLAQLTQSFSGGNSQHSEFQNGYRPTNAHHFGSSGAGTTPSENHMGHQLRHHHQHPHHTQTSKDWQDGFRALLPNVNVSFGALPSQGDSAGHQTANGRLFSSPTSIGEHHSQHHHSHHERVQRQQQQHTGWNDWTVLDPAIVGGQLADSTTNSLNHRSDSPSSWIKASLDQLTSDTFSTQNLIPGFMSINLGGHQGTQSQQQQQHQQQQQQQQQQHGWGGQNSLMANTPPPGFSFNRGATVNHSSNLIQNAYQSYGGLANNSDTSTHKLENEFRGLIRS